MREAQRTRRPFGRLLAMGAALAVLAATACDHGAPSNETTLARIQRAGVVRVGYANEAPYAYMDQQNSRLTGEAPEIARVVLKAMGIGRVEGVLTEFGALIPGLQAKRFDIIAAGMYILPPRCREIAFTNPTYKIGEALLVKARNPLALHSYVDVAVHPTARIAVVAGAVELGYARASGIPDARIAVLPDAPSAVAAVQAGRVDAYGGTALTVQDMLTKAADPGLERAMPFQDPIVDGKSVSGYGAFGMRKADTALRAAFNEHLKGFIGSPAHLDLVKPFGFTRAELPAGMTATRLCGK